MTAENQPNGAVKNVVRVTDNFGAIEFKKTGTYTFTIKEVLPEGVTADSLKQNGWTYDNTEWTLTVVVKAGADGKLYVDANESKLEAGEKTVNNVVAATNGAAATVTVTFTNDYTPNPTEFQPGVEKEVNLVNIDLNELPADISKTFYFTLIPDGNNPNAVTARPSTVSVTVSKGDDGQLKYEYSPTEGLFGKLEFTKAGVYTYTITEDSVVGDEWASGTDKTTWTLTLNVVDVDGQLVVQQTGSSITANPPKTPEDQVVWEPDTGTDTTYAGITVKFTNTYQPESGKLNLGVRKKIDGNGYGAESEKTSSSRLSWRLVRSRQASNCRKKRKILAPTSRPLR